MSGGLGPSFDLSLGSLLSTDTGSEKIQLVRQVSKVAGSEDVVEPGIFTFGNDKVNVLMIGTGEYTTGELFSLLVMYLSIIFNYRYHFKPTTDDR